MTKKILISLGSFVLACALALGIGLLAEPNTSIQAISPDSPCPAVGCASGECHGFDNVPEPDGVHEMTCPEAGCSSVECHAWDTMANRYRQASDASLNLWILAPVALVVGLVALVRVLSRRPDDPDSSVPGESNSNQEGGQR